jgi:hypothetical protein
MQMHSQEWLYHGAKSLRSPAASLLRSLARGTRADLSYKRQKHSQEWLCH